MALFKILQNHAVDNHENEINALGWTEAAKRFPAVAAYLAARRGSEGFKTEHLTHYAPVAVVAGEDLEDVFAILNGAKLGDIIALGRFWSLSVGDIVVTQEGEQYIVDPIGFSLIGKEV